MAKEPESLVFEMLRGMRAEAKANLTAVRNEMAEVKSVMNSLRADLAADLLATRKDLGDQVAGLRRAVVEYHSSTIGHGISIAELEARVRRVEQHLKLPPIEAH